ncbi:gliding motility-associated C-terminal domain-containing protein [Flavobacterium sp.]|uniref:gliding motility-associated C-terminal domain-containing protein n=1 Tax=Flavobacterium sp. TaxID=239 RepID=UPI00286E979F|nr:gliding motility-associated C-terminal domain-containing protein [Flavobacterium sp.]
MKQYFQKIIIGFSVLIPNSFFGQDISLLQQFNGRYDFVFLGNTLNPSENSFQTFPSVYTSSSAVLNLDPNDVIEKAYLYWAGCGTGDFDVKLNGQTINPDRTFKYQRLAPNLVFDYFSAFKDITTLIQSSGNGTYTLSDFDVSPFIEDHFLNKTNFAGWAIIVVYENKKTPLNQVNIYDGLQAVPNEINITLNSLNVIDNIDSKIGFLAWEGDSGIAVNETLRINGNLISNPPLNPANNAFNGTNSFTQASDLYNMDLDVYPIQNNIKIGDTSAQIQLTSGQDFVMINAVVTKLNSPLPDAEITFDTELECNSRTVIAHYTVSNDNGIYPLPAETPIAVYANTVLIQKTKTVDAIPINGNEGNSIVVLIPNTIPDSFELKFVVDDDGTGTGMVTEINEGNNTFSKNITLAVSGKLIPLETLISCNLGLSKGVFDFSDYEDIVKLNSTDNVTFYPTINDLENGTNAILNTANYTAESTPMTIFVKVDNGICFNKTSFLLTTKNCPPRIYNFVSANNDTKNDSFFIEGLRDVFLNFHLSIYNRWGTLIWTGNNNSPDWDGSATKGLLNNHSGVPSGTYYYLLDLNDQNYPKPLAGYLFLTR